MRRKLIAVGLIVVLAGAAWWVWRPGADDPASVPGSSVDSDQPPPQADRVGEPVLESYNTLGQLLAGTPDPATLSVDERKTRMRGLFDVVRAVNQVVPRDTFDLNAVVDQVGREPAKFHARVRTHTVWVPYRGALRGAPGTLMDRAGNSLDRSLLLARLHQQQAETEAAPTAGEVPALINPSRPLPLTAQSSHAPATSTAVTRITAPCFPAASSTRSGHADSRLPRNRNGSLNLLSPPAPRRRRRASGRTSRSRRRDSRQRPALPGARGTGRSPAPSAAGSRLPERERQRRAPRPSPLRRDGERGTGPPAASLRGGVVRSSGEPPGWSRGRTPRSCHGPPARGMARWRHARRRAGRAAPRAERGGRRRCRSSSCLDRRARAWDRSR